MRKRSLRYGTRTIQFRLVPSNRKTLGITVTPALEVIAKVPPHTPEKRVREVMKKRATWILRQQDSFRKYYPKQPVRKFASGETHLYLGRQYRLKLRRRKREKVRLEGRFLNVHCAEPARVESLVTSWYQRQANLRFSQWLEEWTDRFEKYGVHPSDLIVKKMNARWGSCAADGKIRLNLDLIRAPKGCIEYVIIHELCHLVHRKHTAQFFRLQKRMNPQWEKWKERLEVFMATH